MQKSATPASVALRLNNLEQKFEDFEAPEPGGSDIELINRLAKMTISGSATSASGTNWKESTYFFEAAGNPSLASSLYGEYPDFTGIYQSLVDKPFYLQVFGPTHTGKFSSPGSISLSEAIFGSTNDSSDYFASGESSLTKILFGTSWGSEQIESRLEVLNSAGGLFDLLFGNTENAETHSGSSQNLYKCLWGRPEIVEFIGSDISKDLFSLIFGYSPESMQDDFDHISGTNTRTNFLAAVKKMKSDMNALEQRIRFLEVHTGLVP
jgi:hypothetical protein